MIPIRRIAYACALALVALVVPAAPALAQEAPDVLVKRVSQEALDIIRTDPKVQAGDKSHIRDLIEAK
ncbi:MAG TPA: hypothetical protein VGL90_05235, partial [Casimicrobiaceae bacterium]